MTVSHLEEQKYGGDVYPCMTLRTSEYPHDSYLFHFVGRLQIKIGKISSSLEGID